MALLGFGMRQFFHSHPFARPWTGRENSSVFVMANGQSIFQVTEIYQTATLPRLTYDISVLSATRRKGADLKIFRLVIQIFSEPVSIKLYVN